MSLNLPSSGIFTSIQDFLIDEISKPLGLGSYGTVRRALYKPTQALYAVKIISIDENITDIDILGLQRQIQIHRKLNHPHIVKLWDIVSQNSKIYLIMEWAQNGTLFNFQNENPKLSEGTIKKIYSQVLNAMQYIHSQDVMHRDIKPENILLDAKNNVKICDFGSAGYQITRLRNTFCGTYQYMAPEIILEQSYDYRVDIWAVGVLLYELVHNQAPFHAQSLQQMKKCIVQGQYSINQGISPSIKRLITSILQFDPENRPNIKQIISDQWFKKPNQACTSQKQQKLTKKINHHLSNQSLQKYSPINLKHRKHESMDLDYFSQALTKKHFNSKKIFDTPTINKKKLKTQQSEASASIQNWMKSSLRIRTKTQEQENIPINANLGVRKKMKRRIDSTSKICQNLINMNKVKVDQKSKNNYDRIKVKKRKDIRQHKKSTMF